MKRPSFQFYPADWRKDPSLSVCSLAARGLWIDMLCIAHESDDYGTLTINGRPMTAQQIARSVGESADTVADLLAELESAGVLSRRDDGAIFCRRMIRDERLRQIRAESGSQGGNPKLTHGYNREGYLYAIRRHSDGATKIGIATNPTNRLYKIRQQQKPYELDIIGCIQVDDMGLAELEAHAKVAHKKIAADWFSLSEDDLLSLGFTLLSALKGKAKDKPTPSSSASAPSIESKANPLSPSEIAPLGGLSAGATDQPVRPKRQAKPKPSVDLTNGELPAWIPLDDWQSFVDHRRQVKKPATRRAQTMLIDELDRLRQRGQSPSAVLRQSVMRGWTGIFEVKGDAGNSGRGQERESALDRVARKNGFVRTDDGRFVERDEVQDCQAVLVPNDGTIRLGLVGSSGR